VASQLIEEVTAHAQSDSIEDAREICADGTYFLNTPRNTLPFNPWGTRGSMYYIKFFIGLLYKATYWQIRENTANPTLLTNHARHFDKPVIM